MVLLRLSLISLSPLQSKESRLQDLLEAKALALSQADRLIAQYRFQRAQAEAEVTFTHHTTTTCSCIYVTFFIFNCLLNTAGQLGCPAANSFFFSYIVVQARKLGCLLKDAERRREDLQGELSNQVREVERSKADMEELLQHNARLQQDSEEHQALKGAYNTLLNRSETERQQLEVQAGKIKSTTWLP